MMPTRRLRSFVTILALVVLACSDAGADGFTIENGTAITVSIVYETPTGETEAVQAIAPGKRTFLIGFPGASCGQMTLIARDLRGLEIARRTGPVCLDESWVVNASGAP